MKKSEQRYWNLEARVVALENPIKEVYITNKMVSDWELESRQRLSTAMRNELREQQEQISKLQVQHAKEMVNVWKLLRELEQGIKSRRQIMEEMTFIPSPPPPPPEPKPYKTGRCSHCDKRIHQKIEGISWAHDENNNVFCGWVKAAPR